LIVPMRVSCSALFPHLSGDKSVSAALIGDKKCDYPLKGCHDKEFIKQAHFVG
jgi:hypothetical protein